MVHEWLVALTELVVPVIELLALVLIVIGTFEAFIAGAGVMIRRPDSHHAIRAVWLRYARWLVAGLTFQLAADIIGTSIAPSWDEIGQLAAIAVIRTFLNFFLERDQRELREIDREAVAARHEAE